MTVDDKVDEAIAQCNQLQKEIDTLREKLTGTRQIIAILTCPYHEGNVLITNEGLGKNGLLVTHIVPPTIFCLENRWAVRTLSLSKKGEVTMRGVSLEEEGHAVIKVKEKYEPQ